MSGPALPATLPAITLWQPWATWVALGWKTIETRTHPHLRRLAGFRVALHAGKRLHPEAFSIAKAYLGEERGREAWRWLQDGRYPLGAVVCTAQVVWHQRLTAGNSQAALCDCSGGDLFGLLLTGVRRVEPPVPWRGSRGIWYLPADALPAEAVR